MAQSAPLNDVDSWSSFFEAAGVPDPERSKYANVFVENRITDRTIASLTSEHLTAMGITAIGDVLAITQRACSSSEPPVLPRLGGPVSSPDYKPPTVTAKQPQISEDMTQQVRR